MVPTFIRRAAEIELALMVDWAYIHNKSTQNVIDFFKSTARVLNIPDFGLIESAILSYKQLMPTPNELVALSDLAKSRSKFISSRISHNKMSRKTFYKTLNMTLPVEKVLVNKTKIIVNDAIIKFISAFEKLMQDYAAISLNCYDLEE